MCSLAAHIRLENVFTAVYAVPYVGFILWPFYRTFPSSGYDLCNLFADAAETTLVFPTVQLQYNYSI